MSVPLTPERRPPGVTRLLWLAVTLAIIYLSLYPLEGWRLRQPSVLAWLDQGLPRYYTRADVVSNVAAYLAFGVLFVLAWFRPRRFRPVEVVAAVLATTLAGLSMSVVLESIQSYLPTRVPSLLDVLANTFGAFLGAVIGMIVALGLDRRAARLPAASAQWYGQGPALGWALLIAWWLSQLNPQRVLFSGGSLLNTIGPTLTPVVAWVAALLGTSDLATSAASQSPTVLAGAPAVGGLLETLAITTTIALVGVLVMDLVRTPSSRMIWIVMTLLVALLLRAIAAPPGAHTPLLAIWLTPGAQAALVLSAALLYLIAAFHRRTRLWIALGLIPLVLGLTFIASFDPDSLSTQEIGRGMLDPAMTPSLRSLVGALGNGWPLMLAVYCWARLRTLPQRQPGGSL